MSDYEYIGSKKLHEKYLLTRYIYTNLPSILYKVTRVKPLRTKYQCYGPDVLCRVYNFSCKLFVGATDLRLVYATFRCTLSKCDFECFKYSCLEISGLKLVSKCYTRTISSYSIILGLKLVKSRIYT